jgi:hypothetical protein
MKAFPCLLQAGVVLAGSLVHGQALVGRPCLFNEYFPEWRCFPAILRDAEGNLTCGRNRLNLGGITAAPPAAGPVCATSGRFVDSAGPQCHFAYRDAQGGIQDLWYTRTGERDQWHFQKLNLGGTTDAPLAAGNPAGSFQGATYHVVYRDGDGGIQELTWDGHWHHARLGAGGKHPAPEAVGDPVPVRFQGRWHVLYRDFAGVLQDLAFDQGWKVRPMNLGGLTEAPAAAGDPSALDYLNVPHIVYRDLQGQLQDLSYNGGWQAQRLTGGGETSAPPAQGDPVQSVVAGRVRHILYRDLAGGLQDLSFDGTWKVAKLNLGGATEGPAAASDPVTLVPPSNWAYVAYVDAQGTAQLLIQVPGQPWTLMPLDEHTPPGGRKDTE